MLLKCLMIPGPFDDVLSNEPVPLAINDEYEILLILGDEIINVN